jgi:hypothetical protein
MPRHNYTDLSKKIELFWMPDNKSVNKHNDQKIKSSMTKNKIAGSVPLLINGGSERDKSTVISSLDL